MKVATKYYLSNNYIRVHQKGFHVTLQFLFIHASLSFKFLIYIVKRWIIAKFNKFMRKFSELYCLRININVFYNSTFN